MDTETFNDVTIIEAWAKNARPWTDAVREGWIDSRRRVTDRAIVEAILSRSPCSLLDLGCGEGWLMRALSQYDIDIMGVDAAPDLVEAARHTGGGDVRLLSYEQIADGELKAAFDTLVCNFSLLGRESVEGIFAAAPSLLNPNGSFIVQTLHPLTTRGELPYQDGWREGSWAGCGGGFFEPAPWYFRTLESWIALFADHDLQLIETREPQYPDSQQPASVIFIAGT